jgi:ribosomal protein S17E
MSQPQNQANQYGLQTIVNNVAHMRREKNFLEVRQVAIRRELKKIERQLSLSEDEEEMQNLQDVANSLFTIGSDLESYRDHLESELDKVRRGVETLSKLRSKSSKQAFAAYITEDTELSIKSLTHIHSYYDQVIETVRTLNSEDGL